MEKADSLQIHCSPERDGTLVEIKGEITFTDMSFFQDKMETVLTDEKSNVVIDFSGVTYISSAGLRVLLKFNKDASNKKRKLALFGLNEFVSDVFRVSGFDKIFNIQENKEKAFQAVLNS